MKRYPMEVRAAIAFIIAQILFKIIFEFEGSRIFAETHRMPAFIIIVAFTIAWAIICILCLFRLRIGYLLAVILGVLNLFPLVLLIYFHLCCLYLELLHLRIGHTSMDG
jgi:hypothetical protein